MQPKSRGSGRSGYRRRIGIPALRNGKVGVYFCGCADVRRQGYEGSGQDGGVRCGKKAGTYIFLRFVFCDGER